MSVQKLQHALNAVPLLRHLTVIVAEADPGAVTLTLGTGASVTDHAGNIHSAALFALGEAAAGVALSTHPKLTHLRPRQQASGIKYLRPCTDAPLVEASITDTQISEITALLNEGKPAKIEVISKVSDDTGSLVAEVVCVFLFR